MRSVLLLLGLMAVLSVSTSSCVTMKKDCQGVRHTKLKNGIYL
jgi:hypothetical protein